MSRGMIVVHALLGLGAVVMLFNTHSILALALWMLIALRPGRYLLCLAGMGLIRAYVVRQVRSNAGQLPDPGAVADPDAPWRQWLDGRCRSCGA